MECYKASVYVGLRKVLYHSVSLGLVWWWAQNWAQVGTTRIVAGGKRRELARGWAGPCPLRNRLAAHSFEKFSLRFRRSRRQPLRDSNALREAQHSAVVHAFWSEGERFNSGPEKWYVQQMQTSNPHYISPACFSGSLVWTCPACGHARRSRVDPLASRVRCSNSRCRRKWGIGLALYAARREVSPIRKREHPCEPRRLGLMPAYVGPEISRQ